MAAAPAVPPSVLNRLDETLTIADFAQDSETEYIAAPLDSVYRTTFSAVRTARAHAAAIAALPAQEALRARIRTRLQSRSFQRLLRTVTGRAQHDLDSKYGPRGSILPGRKNAVWKFRAEYGPATERRPTFVVKTRGHERGRTQRDLANEEDVQRMLWRRNVVPVPRVYFGLSGTAENAPAVTGLPLQEVTVMEDVKGRMVSGFEGWSRRKKLYFCKQLAAVRIFLLGYRSTHIGSFDPADGPDVPPPIPANDCGFHRDRAMPEGNRSGPMRDGAGVADGRGAYRNLVPPRYNDGPYSSVLRWLDGCLHREYCYWRNYDASVEPPGARTGITLRQLRRARRNIRALRGYFRERTVASNAAQGLKAAQDEYYVRPRGNYRFSHNSLDRGRNIMVRGAKIVAILDWENAMFLPLSEALRGMSEQSMGYWGRRRWASMGRQPRLQTTLAPHELSLTNGAHDVAEGPGSDYESDRDENGTRMYEDSDGGDYRTEDEMVEVPHFHRTKVWPGDAIRGPYDSWDDFITPTVSMYVHNWLRAQVQRCVNPIGINNHADIDLFTSRLTVENETLAEFTNGPIDVEDVSLVISRDDLQMIIDEYPEEAGEPSAIPPLVPMG